jgi:hypothetical protein
MIKRGCTQRSRHVHKIESRSLLLVLGCELEAGALRQRLAGVKATKSRLKEMRVREGPLFQEPSTLDVQHRNRTVMKYGYQVVTSSSSKATNDVVVNIHTFLLISK